MQKSIIIDATHLGVAQPTGVEYYTSEILPRISSRLIGAGWPVSWVGHTSDSPTPLPKGVQWIHSPHHPGWSQLVLPKLLKTLKPYIFFTPSGIPPVRCPVKSAMVVHDMGVYRFGENYLPGEVLRLGWLSKLAAKHASLIISPSTYTTQEIRHFWPKYKGALVVIQHGYEAPKASAEAVPNIAAVPLFLFVGRIENKKNLRPLIEGFARAAEEQDMQLVLAGKHGYGAATLEKYIHKLPEKVRNRIHLLSYISEAQKVWLYQYAAAGVLPCPAEGFGMPVLDCFHFGVIPICAQAGALPEVAGEAGLYVQEDSPTDWYLHLRDVAKGSIDRAHLVAQGKSRLAHFDWERAAEETASALLAL